MANIGINQLVAEIKGNQRLRIGVWVILGILWLYGILLMQDQVQQSEEAYLTASKKLARAKEVLAETEWPARLEAARSTRLELEGHLWRESTIGLAQASFQDWLTQVAQQVNLPKSALSVAAHEETTADTAASESPATGGVNTQAQLWKVNAKLMFDFEQKSFYPLLLRLADHDKWVFIDSLVIRGAPAPRVELGLVAYFRKPISQTTDGVNDKSALESKN